MTKHTSILAEFNTPYDLIHAAEKVRDKGIKKFDTYSPFPIHGMDDAMGLKDSNLDFIVLCGGAIGASIGLGLQIWVSHIAYPLLISGKDTLSIPAFIPVTFELMILLAAFATVFGMFAINKLPMLYHRLFKSKNFLKVTSHGFFITIESTEPTFDINKTKEFLVEIGGKNIEVLED